MGKMAKSAQKMSIHYIMKIMYLRVDIVYVHIHYPYQDHISHVSPCRSSPCRSPVVSICGVSRLCAGLADQGFAGDAFPQGRLGTYARGVVRAFGTF